jgi:nitrogen regulatory protein P-II 2
MKRMKEVTIIVEAAIEEALISEVKKLGATGYTAWEARGEGHHGARRGDWEQSRNVCVKVVCDPALAGRIVKRLTEAYSRHYAMVVYLNDVDVAGTE